MNKGGNEGCSGLHSVASRLVVGVVAVMVVGLLIPVGVSPRPVSAAPLAVSTATDELLGSGTGAYRWGELTLRGTDWHGAAAGLKVATDSRDVVIGVVGGRWDDQIDFGAGPDRGGELLDIEFPDGATEIVLTIGMVGLGEGRNDEDEAGVWRGYDASGQLVDSGPLSPAESDLGPGVKVPKTKGTFPISLGNQSTIHRLQVEAVDWNPLGSKPAGTNNSDLGIVGVSWTSDPTSAPGSTSTPQSQTSPTPVPQSSDEPGAAPTPIPRAIPSRDFSCRVSGGVISWTESDARKYRIHRSSDDGRTWTFVVGTKDTSFADEAHTSGDIYEINRGGETPVRCTEEPLARCEAGWPALVGVDTGESWHWVYGWVYGIGNDDLFNWLICAIDSN